MSFTQKEKASRFRSLHGGPGAFVLPNPWDVGSARMLAGVGFQALATSSAASACAIGRRDGGLTRDEALAHAQLIVDATNLPVTADLEWGYGDAPEAVAETIRLAAEVGLLDAALKMRPEIQAVHFTIMPWQWNGLLRQRRQRGHCRFPLF